MGPTYRARPGGFRRLGAAGAWTAPARSGSVFGPGEARREDVPQALELLLHARQEFGADDLLALVLQIPFLAQLDEPLLRALDRVLLLVQEVLHEEDQLDLLGAVDPVAGPVLRRVQKLEL